MTQEQMMHDLQLKGRRVLTVSGVSEVVSFEESSVVLKTGMGILLVQGQQLQLKKLSEENGQVAVEGTVCALSYEEPREPGGWWRRLLG